MLFTIIIPVFNVEKYLLRCVQSVLEQKTNFSYELLLIDDGSTDKSKDICDMLEEQNEKIKVVHKNNEGLSVARNIGIRKANGQYIIFLDSDDYLVDGAMDTLGEFLSQATPDILYCNINLIIKNKLKIIKKIGIHNGIEYTGEEFLKDELRSGKFQAMAQLGIYKKDFLLSNELWFKKGILHEDEEWSPRVILKAKKVYYLNYNYYNYEIRDNSITQKKDKTKNSSDLIDTCYSLEHFFAHSDKEMVKLYSAYLAKLYMAAVSECLLRGNITQIKSKLKKSFLWKKWINKRDFIKIMMFYISPKFYAKKLEKARVQEL